jgi:hypothetical protein
MKNRLTTLATLLLAAPALLSAHSGHGKTDGETLLHYLTEPQHLAAVLTTLLIAVLIVRIGLQRRKEGVKAPGDA